MVSICQVFKWLGCPVFKRHSNTRPFGIQPLFNCSNTKLVWYSDPHIFKFLQKSVTCFSFGFRYWGWICQSEIVFSFFAHPVRVRGAVVPLNPDPAIFAKFTNYPAFRWGWPVLEKWLRFMVKFVLIIMCDFE